MSEWPDDSIFNHFNVFEETYKTVEPHSIKAAILIPKGLKPGSHPVIINTHGGFLIYGHALFAPFFSPWALRLALEGSAIIISGDYRLLPSAHGVKDILDDVEDFWQWTRLSLDQVLERLAPGHSIDRSQLLLTGSSAGGYTAMQLALSHPTEVSAMAMAYPFVNPKDRLFVKGLMPDEPNIAGFKSEDIPSKDAVLSWIEEARKEPATRAGFERLPYAIGATQLGLFDSKVFDHLNLDGPDFVPLSRIQRGESVPKKIWIFHGDADRIVDIRNTTALIDSIQKNQPDVTVRLDIAHGEDHAFDHLKSTWELHAIGALEFVKDSWLNC